MTADTERVWLVRRSYGADEDLVTLVYATADGRRQLKKQLSHNMLYGTEITAARDVPVDRLESVPDDERDEFADEASRMAERHDPDEAV
jgi:hypothetical protein